MLFVSWLSLGEVEETIMYYRKLGLVNTAKLALGVLFNRKTIKVKWENFVFYLRINTSDIKPIIFGIIDGEYDYYEIKNPSVIIDGGAHIGTFSIFMAQRFPNAKIVAIEPDINNFRLLQRNTKPYHNIITIRAALSIHNRPLNLYKRPSGTWGFTTIDQVKNAVLTDQVVQGLTILKLLDQINESKIDLLKLDIEGAEKSLLEHADEWIDKVNVISAELHDRLLDGCAVAFREATKDFFLIRKHGEKITAFREV